jgi:ribosomal protein L37AE/L43A
MTQLDAFTAWARRKHDAPPVTTDDKGLPSAVCAQCARGLFYRRAAEGTWHCAACEPAIVPEDFTGWAWCGVPPAIADDEWEEFSAEFEEETHLSQILDK